MLACLAAHDLGLDIEVARISARILNAHEPQRRPLTQRVAWNVVTGIGIRSPTTTSTGLPWLTATTW